MLVGVLGQVRLGFEYDGLLAADGRGPEGAEPLRLDGGRALAHLAGQRRKIVRVGNVVVAGIFSGRQNPAQRVPLIHGPRDDEDIGTGQRLGAASRRSRSWRRSQALGPWNVDEAAEPGRLRERQEGGAFRTLGVEVDDVALNVVETRIASGRGVCRERRFGNRDGGGIGANIARDPGAVDNHEPLQNKSRPPEMAAVSDNAIPQ